MNTVDKQCLFCNRIFQAFLREIKRGNAKYCSRSCSSKAYGKKIKDTLVSNCKCAFCDIKFYRGKTKKENSKSGLQFCSRICKDKAQRIESNITAIHPDHYGDGKHSYRAMAFRAYPIKCNRCNWNEIIDILEVHHKDHNRENNDISNLEILCSRCHDKHHFLTKTGKWSKQLVENDGSAPSFQICKT